MEVAHTLGRDVSYTASKAALNMISVRQSVHLRDAGITVVCIHPGFLKTDMGGSGAPLSPDESVAAMLEVIDRLEPSDTGRFLDHRGKEVPW